MTFREALEKLKQSVEVSVVQVIEEADGAQFWFDEARDMSVLLDAWKKSDDIEGALKYEEVFGRPKVDE